MSASPELKPLCVDAHHHLWRYSPTEYPWIDDSMKAIRRDYLPETFLSEMKSAGVDGSVVVQARQTLDETASLLELAESTPEILGVVGWVPILADSVAAALDRFSGRSKLKGLRHVIQDEPDDRYMLREDFNAGIRALKGSGLVYEILILERQLPQAIEFVDLHPDQVFVLDHLGKPEIAAGRKDPWATRLCKLAERPNVWCKVSGMATQADWNSWTPESLRPYLDVAVEAFTPQRLMAGSDWPVCLVASGYERWWEVLRAYFADFTATERAAVLGGNAVDVYGLKPEHRAVVEV